MINEQNKFIVDVAKLILFAESIGVKLTGGELYRTREQQKIYFDTGKSRTMNSYHLKRLAIDFNFFIDGKLTLSHPKIEQIGKHWESLDPMNRAGMFFDQFKDFDHFERKI
jgi:hypothetical protein